MQDLTIKKEDKKDFICSIEPFQDKVLRIKYADSTNSFIEDENLEKYKVKMEEQFKTFSHDFVIFKKNQLLLLKTLKSLIDFFVIGEFMYLAYNIDVKNLQNFLTALMVSICTIFSISLINRKIEKIKCQLGNVEATQYYLDNKDVFKMMDYDKEQDEYYEYDIVDLNNIQKFVSKTSLTDFVSSYLDKKILRR